MRRANCIADRNLPTYDWLDKPPKYE